MKIRKGFVSNSSSSSFVCDISGRTESGYDIGLKEVEMIVCNNGHCMSEEYVLEYIAALERKYGMEHIRQLLRNADYDIDVESIISPSKVIDFINELDDGRYELESCFCPMCNLIYIENHDILNYILWNSGTTRQEVVQQMQERFVTHEVFREAVQSDS
jgi:hypothetical protein